VYFVSCKSHEDTSSSKPGRETSGDPDQQEIKIDTRFQEAFFNALELRGRGEWQKAIQAFEQCIEVDPKGSASVHYELSRIYRVHQNNPGSALEHAKSAVDSDGLNPWYHHELGDVYLAMEQYDLAVKEYQIVEKLNPDDPNNLYEQATALLYAGKLKEAIRVYDRVESQSGVYEELSMQKHQLYIELNMPEKAGLELEKLARAYPEEPAFWGDALQFYMRTGQTEKIAPVLEELRKSDPANGMVHYQLSEYYAAIGQNAKSYEELKLAFGTTDVGIDQKVAILLKYYSLTEFDPTYLSQAFELLELTEQIHPAEAKSYAIYGDFLYREKRDLEALTKFHRAIELDPARSQIWAQILVIEAQNDLSEQLAKDSKEAIANFPSLPDFYLYQGIALEKQRKYEAALESFTAGKELVIDDPSLTVQFLSSIGGVYHEMKRHEDSDAAYNDALELDPENVFVLNNFAYYLALRKENLARAAEMARKCNELDPGNSSFEDTYAWVLYQKGEYSSALTWIVKASESGGNKSPDVLEHYGDILYKLNRREEALQKWTEAKKAGAKSAELDVKLQDHPPD
jgi:tetratricopeptide (TPR) repeat protein